MAEGETMRGSRFVRLLAAVFVCVLALSVLGGCGSNAEQESSDEQAGTTAEPEVADDTTTDAAQTGAAVSDAGQIPPGSEFAEGGGGPLSYSFREEWRRALPEAQKWRSGAYLISAVGEYVNNDGVPSEWRFSFIDSDNPDALLWVTIDPWGNVTNTEEKTGDAVSANVSKFDKPVPYEIIDSDEAVRIATEVLGERYDLADTKEPLIGLGWSVMGGGGPYWNYNLFYSPTAEYISAQINALTGEVTPQE